MSILLSAHQLTKSFAARPLFKGLTFSVESGDRIGLIGPNGAGKSTLLRILASKISPDSGTLSLGRGLRVGFLEQVPTFADDATVFASVLEGSDDPYEWENQRQVHELISRFELDRFGDDAPLSSMSGGWKKRVALARELVKKPDLLLLDEPTNHLDVETILWLEQLIDRSQFATMTITHDRAFLQAVSNRIIELDPRHEGGLLDVKGDYASYLETREQLIAAQERREVVLKNTLRRETEWVRRGAKARTTKQQARIQRHGELKEEVEGLSVRNQVRTARIDFQSSDKNPKKLIDAQAISKSYGDKRIFSKLDLRVTPGTRIGLLGPNGSGKSTLIRVLLGHEAPDTGTVTRSEHLSVAYFDQTRESLNPETTLVKTLCPSGEFVDYRGSRVHIRSYCDRFLFTQGQMDMPVGRLSGGEQSRVLIAKLMLNEANLLVLDEPTNDLDMATLAVLEDCLCDFGGAVLLVAHDRYFLDQVATQLLAFPPGGGDPVAFADLSQWEDWHAEQNTDQAKAAARQSAAAAAKPQSAAAGANAPKRKLGYKEQRELESMEANIQAAEKELDRLTAESVNPANLTNAVKLSEIVSQMTETQAKIDRLYARWQELGG